MNGRTIARILLAIVLIGGAITLGIGAYNAGVTAGLAQTGQVVVANGGYLAPGGAYIGYGWGFGWGHGFGFFGFLGGLLFLFLLIGLFRAAFGGPRRGWGPGYGPGRRHGWGSGWEDRAREAHDAWHREHPEAANGPDRPTA
ncbi:MAG TPA: hypothetical protein VFR93_08710 [Candidatus Limnocylindrales bacterium]|jgi:hypothetical protein|nr:hypothetical protein [Candidatus Limnocylindrales bacterium]